MFFRFSWWLALVLCVVPGRTAPACFQSQPERGDRFQSWLAHLAAANSALRLHEAVEAKRWLELAPGDRDSWEWRWLHHQSDSSLRRFPTGDWTAVRVEYSPAGERLMIAGSDGWVRIVDSDSLEIQREFQAAEQAVYAARFNPQGTRIATCSRDGKLVVWDAASGGKLWEQSSGGEGLADLVWHPEGKQIAFCSWFRGPQSVLGLVSLWDAESGEQTWKTEFGVKPVVVAKFSPDGSRLAVGTWDAVVGIWDLASPQDPLQLDFGDVAGYSAIDDIAFSPDGTRIAAASKNGSPRIWNLATGGIEGDFRGHSSAVFSIAFADDQTLLSGGSDGVLAFWDTSRAELADRRFGHDNRIGSIAVRPGGLEIATASADRTVRIWSRPATGRFEAENRSRFAYGTALSQDCRLLAAGGSSPAEVTVWDAESRKVLHTLAGLEGSINFLAFGPDSLLVGGNWSSEMVVWNAATGETVRRLDVENLGGVQQCACSADGKWIAASMRNRVVAVWEAGSGRLIAKLAVADGCWGLDFSPDSQRLAVGDGAGNLHLYSVGGWQELESFSGVESQSNAVRFSPDGSLVACGGENGRLVVFDLAADAVRFSITAHSERVWTLDFLPDGSRLATGGADLKVRLWELDSGNPVLTLAGFQEPVYNLVFSEADGTLFVNEISSQRAFRVPPRSGKTGN